MDALIANWSNLIEINISIDIIAIKYVSESEFIIKQCNIIRLNILETLQYCGVTELNEGKYPYTPNVVPKGVA